MDFTLGSKLFDALGCVIIETKHNYFIFYVQRSQINVVSYLIYLL